MRKINVLLLGILAITLTSCRSTYQLIGYKTSFTVETPTNKHEPYKNISTFTIDEGSYIIDIDDIKESEQTEQLGNAYTPTIPVFYYSDSIIDIAFVLNRWGILFDIQNKTNHSIKINWDDIVFVGRNYYAGRVIHKGIPLGSTKDPQVPTSILRNTKYSDYLIPEKSIHIEYDEEDGFTYRIDRLLYIGIKKNKVKKLYNDTKQETLGTIQLQIPIVIEGIQNNYIFSFTIDDVIMTDRFMKDFSHSWRL